MTRILGLETSCDETAAAIVEDGRRCLANVVWSQHALHAAYRGVVPEIASRAHLERLQPVIQQALDEAHCGLESLDAIAVGNRPGLIGSLIVGVSAAKALAWSLNRPLVGIDHVQAHLYAPFVSLAERADEAHCDGSNTTVPAASGDDSAAAADSDDSSRRYPALGLVVSGGHTSMYAITGPSTLHRLGSTIDDAAGEAFDKAAAILEAGYPGGPAIEQLAQAGDPSQHRLPNALLNKTSLDFSFSGLKTALLYSVCGRPQGRGKSATFPHSAAELSQQQRADLAAAFQKTVVDALIIKLDRALDQMAQQGEPAKTLIVGGGVSANALLRQQLETLAENRRLPLHVPPMSLCLDNAAMIAGLAHHHLEAGHADDLDLPAMASAEPAQ